jgi:hypothetical protein
LVPTPPGKKHVIKLVVVLTPMHDLDEDRITDVKETAVWDDDVPKLEPTIVIETPPDVGLPDPVVTLDIDGLS